MKFSFIIVTDGKNLERLDKVIKSIELEHEISKKLTEKMIYEIVIVGNVYNSSWRNTKIVEFNELENPGWITKKKNIGVKNSKYENLVIMHDYIELDKGWYEGYLNFKEDFDICMNKIYKCDGKRFTDWVLCVSFYEKFKRKYNLDPYRVLFPYDMDSRYTKIMYISGAYFVVKKDVMIEFPFNESLFHGDSEDIEWSSRVRNHFKFSLNKDSKVIVNRKGKRNLRSEMDKRVKDILEGLSDKEISEMSKESTSYFFDRSPSIFPLG